MTVNNPAAADWFIMLRGYRTFSGLTLVATYSGTALIPVATPTFSPAPGTYPQQQNVTLTTATSTAMIR